MLVRQGRIFAKDEITAVLLIREKHGKGEMLVKECNVQPRKDLTWYEYVIDVVYIAPRYNDCPY